MSACTTQPRLVPKPHAVSKIEARIGAAVPLHPNLISAGKLLLVLPLAAFALSAGQMVWLAVALVAFGLLDALDGIVARTQGKATRFGMVFDRVTDLPLILLLGAQLQPALPFALLAARVAIDLVLWSQYLRGDATTENRLRTVLTWATLLALFGAHHGWCQELLAASILLVSVFFGAAVALRNARVISRRRIADTLSGLGLIGGVASIFVAAAGQLEISLLLLLAGALLDGLDGAAARRFGGSRFGVLADDIADAVNYGIAPGAACGLVLGGFEGWFIGGLYAAFVIARLVYFTLRKGEDDPRYFAGAPSTVGGVVVICALLLAPAQPALVGLICGAACVAMVSFHTPYRHPGRWIAATLGGLRRRRKLALGLSAVALLLSFSMLALEAPAVAAALLLAAALAYVFRPASRRFREAMGGAR